MSPIQKFLATILGILAGTAVMGIGGAPMAAHAAFLKGDVDLSGSLTYLDADIMSQYAVGSRTLTEEQKLAGDMSGDGQVTSYDAALLLQEIKGNGDVNGDSMIDQEDAQYINDVVVGKSSFTANQKTVGDVSGDGAITSYDAALLLQWTSTIVVEAGSTSAVITWTTPRSADSRVEYGTTASYGMSARDSLLTTSHKVNVDGLPSSTAYHFRVLSQDSAGNKMISDDKTFTTLSPAVQDIVVSDIKPVEVTATTGTIEWKTNQLIQLSVAFSTDEITGVPQTSTGSSFLVGQTADGRYLYRATIDSLQPRTRYFYRIFKPAADPGQLPQYFDASFNYLRYVATTAESTDYNLRIQYWYGKVNQHVENGVWKTDSDGVSGANLDKLAYCKKWYPYTTRIEDYRYETIFDYKAAGNTGSYTGTHLSTRCIEGTTQPPVTGVHRRGSANAAITLEEWVDYKSPFVVRFAPIVNELIESFGGRVNLVVKHFPLTSLYQQSDKVAEAMECAASQGDAYFWKLHDWLLGAAPSVWDVNAIKDYAATTFAGSGFDAASFNACIDGGATASVVNDYYSEGTGKGISGVPWTLVLRNADGAREVVQGAVEYSGLKAAVDKLLGAVPPPSGKIVIHSPAQGERWYAGKVYAVRWAPPYVVSQGSVAASLTLPAETVSITLAPYYACWDVLLPCAMPAIAPYTITSYAPNTGSYQWKIPLDLPSPYLGTQRITISLNGTDQRGTSASFTVAAPSTPVNKPPVITGVSGPTALQVNEAGRWTVTAYDPDGTFLSYKVDWGDRSSQPSPLSETAPPYAPAQEAAFTHSYSAPGRYTVRFTVRDEKGGSVESTLTIEVGNAVSMNSNPKMGSAAIPAEIAAGARVSFSFSAEDPDGDHLGWEVSWGDNTGEEGACPAPAAGTAFQPSHIWEKAGIYKVQVAVRDCRGGSAQTSFQVVVSGPTQGPFPLPAPREPQPVPTEDKEGEIQALRERIRRLELKISELEQQVIETEKRLTHAIDPALTQRVAGNILLQVEKRGEAWYADPVTGQRYYLKDGERAYTALQAFGLGIADKDLAKIPVGIEERAVDEDADHDGLPDKLEEAIGTSPAVSDSDADGYPDGFELKNGYNPSGTTKLMLDPSLAGRLEGRIVLDVTNRGRAWWIHDGKRYYMKDGEQAYQIMRFLSLGITNNDLRKIGVGELQ